MKRNNRYEFLSLFEVTIPVEALIFVKFQRWVVGFCHIADLRFGDSQGSRMKAMRLTAVSSSDLQAPASGQGG